MKPTITTAELLTELDRATRLVHTEDNAFTLAELLEVTGWGPIQARKKLLLAKRAGHLEVVRVLRENITGAMQGVPGYRITAPKKGKTGRRR
jgi:hypothetical protein